MLTMAPFKCQSEKIQPRVGKQWKYSGHKLYKTKVYFKNNLKLNKYYLYGKYVYTGEF